MQKDSWETHLWILEFKVFYKKQKIVVQSTFMQQVPVLRNLQNKRNTSFQPPSSFGTVYMRWNGTNWVNWDSSFFCPMVSLHELQVSSISPEKSSPVSHPPRLWQHPTTNPPPPLGKRAHSHAQTPSSLQPGHVPLSEKVYFWIARTTVLQKYLCLCLSMKGNIHLETTLGVQEQKTITTTITTITAITTTTTTTTIIIIITTTTTIIVTNLCSLHGPTSSNRAARSATWEESVPTSAATCKLCSWNWRGIVRQITGHFKWKMLGGKLENSYISGWKGIFLYMFLDMFARSNNVYETNGVVDCGGTIA